MDKNRISIIIPVYNAEDFLDKCLESVLRQGFTSYEVLLIDDGSTDSSPLICDRYSATDSRFRVIHKKNGGVSSARNAGINLAKGEYLMFVDSDDELLPDALDVMMRGISGEDLVLGGYTASIGGVPRKENSPSYTRSYKEKEMAGFFDDNIIRNCDMLDAPWAKLFKRKAVGNLRFCEELNYAEDKLFVFSFFSRCTSAYTCSEPIYVYKIRPGSLGSDISSDRHLMQLHRFIPLYAKAIETLVRMYPDSRKLRSLYHNDVVGRYICRILNIFIRRRTGLLTPDYLEWVYSVMSVDPDLGLFSVRAGQVFNIMLYKIGKVGVSIPVYRFLARINSIFR